MIKAMESLFGLWCIYSDLHVIFGHCYSFLNELFGGQTINHLLKYPDGKPEKF